MAYENDFVKEEVVDLKIEGYKKGDFKYNPTDAGAELDWLDEYMVIGEDKKPKPSYAKLNKLKFRRITEVPYDQSTIKNAINIDKAWNDLDVEERWTLIRKLKGPIFDKILNAMDTFDKGDNAAKKA